MDNIHNLNKVNKETQKIKMRKKYINIPLPDELAKQIDELIKKSELGYKTKSEFIKEAVRERLIRIGDWLHLEKNNKQDKKPHKP